VSTTELVALLGGQEVGRVHRDSRGHLRFVYAGDWRQAPDSYPLSISIPLTAAEHPHSRIEAFLWGLLPDNDRVLERWARQFHVRPNAFSLLAHVGEECAGAVQFALPEDVPGRRRATSASVEWLSEQDVAERLRALRGDQTSWRRLGDSGQFSLAGAQSKTALLLRGRRWGVPSGRIPTTHILKPPMADLLGHVENEHFCLELARSVGLPAARSSVQRFGDEIAIVIERYDRVLDGAEVIRVHQEDTCQALGIMPTKKYENEGGPGAKTIVNLLRDVSSSPLDDVWTFATALGFSWLTGGTDAHAKNYSLLFGRAGQIRLAPLYDLGSILLYPEFSPKKANLAMKIGTKYLFDQVGLRQWLQAAKAMRLDPEQLVVRLRTLAAQLPDAAVDVRKQADGDGLTPLPLDRLAAAMTERAHDCRRALD